MKPGNSPRFSVVIAAYNAARFIEATLKSVFAQEFTDYEVIVVDDGSVDATAEIASTFPSVKVIRQTNKGPGAARNRGVEESSGEYIAFLDSDDIWFPWTLATVEDVIGQHELPDIICMQLKEFTSGAGPPTVSKDQLKVRKYETFFDSSPDGLFVGACILVARKVAFLQVEGFTESVWYAEDLDLSLKLGPCRGFAKIDTPTTVGYRVHAASARNEYAIILTGLGDVISRELRNAYPGGRAKRRDRWRIITLATRSESVACLRRGDLRSAANLYVKTLRMNIAIGRLKYVLGFPAACIITALQVQ